MGQKTNNRILWHGNGLNAEGKAVAPVKAAAGGDGTDGLNEGELYICNSDSDPALFILTDAGNVVRIDGNGSDTYTRAQINEKLNAKVDVAFFSRLFGLMDEDGGEIQVNDVETMASSIKAKLGFWTEQYLSALGLNPDAGSTSGGSTTLAGLEDVSITGTPGDGQVLAFDVALGKWKPADAVAGLDEEELAQYLTANNYAKKTDITAALAGYATQDWVTGQGYALKTTRVIAGAGLTGGGTLAADRTLALATVGTAGTYVKVTVDQYGRVTGHGSLAASDIPTLSISKISGLQSELNSKLDVNVFEELFEKVYVSGYGYAIRAKLALYTEGWMSAKGQNPDAGAAAGGSSTLAGLTDVSLGSLSAGQILSWNGSKWTNAAKPASTWNEITGKPSWIGSTKPTYSFSEILNNPTTIAGYRITDAYTKTEADGRYVNVSGDTMTGGLSIKTYNYGDALNVVRNSNTSAGAISFSNNTGLLGIIGVGGSSMNEHQPIFSQSGSGEVYMIWHSGNDGSGSGLDADLLDGVHLSDIRNGNVYSATRLQTARTLWGQSFNGTANVSGSMGSVGNISLISNYAYDCGSLGAQWNNVYSRAYHIGQARGMNYISEGNGDNATYDTFNLKIHAHWGIGIVGNEDVCRMFIDARTGSLSMKGNLTVAGTATFNSQSVHNYGILTSMIKINQYLEIGSARLYYDSSTNALYVQKSDGTACGFYATGFMSAKGLNPDAGATAGGSGNYVSRDGDTMTGLLTISTSGNQQLYLDGTSQAQVAYRVNGANRALTGYSNTSGAFVQCGSNWINIPTSGGVYYNNQYEMWHAGNDGSGSGLDADLLDGTHKSGLLTAASSSNATNLSITVGGTTKTISSIYADYLGGTSKANLFSSMSYSSNKLNITIGGTTKSVTIQAGSSGSYLPLSGGTITGNLQVNGKATFNTQSVHNYGILTSNIYTNQSMYIRYGSANTARIYCNWASGMIISVDGANTEFSNTYIATGTSTASAYDLGLSNRRWRTIYSVNALNTSSDLRLKSVLGDIPLTVDAVAAAPSFLYRWKTGKDVSVHAGSAAQYWQQALPQAVTKGEDGFLAMEYDRIALAAVITTARTVVDHETRLKNLEQKIQCLTTPQGSDALPDK